MNLIEQLGGYERAKEKMDNIVRTLDNCELLGGGDAREGLYERLESIDKALLEYRRQHNIFEVGDYFVNYADDAVYTALSIDQNNRMHGKSGDKNVWTYFGRFGLRHATDEEIAAGKRLESDK